jgi:hypothetical protein
LFKKRAKNGYLFRKYIDRKAHKNPSYSKKIKMKNIKEKKE